MQVAISPHRLLCMVLAPLLAPMSVARYAQTGTPPPLTPPPTPILSPLPLSFTAAPVSAAALTLSLDGDSDTHLQPGHQLLGHDDIADVRYREDGQALNTRSSRQCLGSKRRHARHKDRLSTVINCWHLAGQAPEESCRAKRAVDRPIISLRASSRPLRA